MKKHLTTLVLSGVLGTLMLAGNAEACHKKKCACAAPVACAPAPVVYAQPAPCPRPVKTCAPKTKVKKCGGGGLLAGLCHKKKAACAPAPCATTVSYAYNYTTVAPSGQSMSTPQATTQSWSTPPVPAKSMGTPQR